MIRLDKFFLSDFFRKESLKNSIFWSFVGNLIFLGCQWLVMIVLARMSTPFLAGQYAIALGFTMPVIAICQMQLTQIQITDIKKEHSLKDYFVFRSIMLLIGFLLILLLTTIFYTSDLKLIVFLFITKSFESLGEVVYGHLQLSDKFKELAFIKIFRGILTISTVIFCVYSKLDLGKMTMVLSLISFFIFLLVEYRLIISLVRKDTFGKWMGFKKIFIVAFPLGLSSGLNSVTTNLPRYFLNYYYGKEVVGFFSVVYSPITWLSLIPGVMSQVILPKTAYYLQNKQLKEYMTIIMKYTIIVSAFFIFIVFVFNIWGEELLTILFGHEYSKFSSLLKILSISLIIANVGCIGPYTISASRSFWSQFFAIVISFFTMVLGCYFGARSNWINIGWAEVLRESVGMLYYLTVAYFIIGKLKPLKI